MYGSYKQENTFCLIIIIYSDLMSLQSLHLQIYPRQNFPSQHAQTYRHEHIESILRALSYALSTSLNNYHSLLKNSGVMLQKQAEKPNKNQNVTGVNHNCRLKRKIIMKEKENSAVMVKTKPQKHILEAKKEKPEEKQPPKPKNAQFNIFFESKNQKITLGDQNLKPSNIKLSQNAKKQDLILANANCLLGQATLPKMQLMSEEKQRILQNLLKREVIQWPLKKRPIEGRRAVRSLTN